MLIRWGDNSINFIPDYYTNFLNGTDYDLMKINFVAPTASAIHTIPTSLIPLHPIAISLANRIRTFVFDTISEMGIMPNFAAGPFSINQKLFEMDSINETVFLNDVEIWTLINNTKVAHPFHIHDVQFYIVDINGKKPPTFEKGLKDVVLVMPSDTVRFITKFENYADNHVPYMYHCHILHHEDDGMMGSFLVIDTTNNSSKNLVVSNEIKVFPNPSTGKFTITLNENNNAAYYEIINLNGAVIKKKNMESTNSFTIDLSNQTNGLYLLHIISADENKHFTKRINLMK